MPVLKADGTRFEDTVRAPGYSDPALPPPNRRAVRAHRAMDRTRPPATIHWRSITRDNITTCYGTTADSRIADPDDPAACFQLAHLRELRRQGQRHRL